MVMADDVFEGWGIDGNKTDSVESARLAPFVYWFFGGDKDVGRDEYPHADEN